MRLLLLLEIISRCVFLYVWKASIKFRNTFQNFEAQDNLNKSI